MAAANRRSRRPDTAVQEDLATTYNEFKEFEGRKYTGMKVGRGHRWHYDPGIWKETKMTPDRWEFTYAVRKRRSGKAPEGSGVPVGTEYHWYILAHQNVRKLDANTYTTAMAGLKYKLAHKRADKGAWSSTDRAQRKRLIQILQELIGELQRDLEARAPVPRAGRRRGRPAERRSAAAGARREMPRRERELAGTAAGRWG